MTCFSLPGEYRLHRRGRRHGDAQVRAKPQAAGRPLRQGVQGRAGQDPRAQPRAARRIFEDGRHRHRRGDIRFRRSARAG